MLYVLSLSAVQHSVSISTPVLEGPSVTYMPAHAYQQGCKQRTSISPAVIIIQLASHHSAKPECRVLALPGTPLFLTYVKEPAPVHICTHPANPKMYPPPAAGATSGNMVGTSMCCQRHHQQAWGFATAHAVSAVCTVVDSKLHTHASLVRVAQRPSVPCPQACCVARWQPAAAPSPGCAGCVHLGLQLRTSHRPGRAPSHTAQSTGIRSSQPAGCRCLSRWRRRGRQ